LNKVNSIILDTYKSYTIMPPEPATDGNGNISLAAMRAHYAACNENKGEFYLLNQFRVALPVDLRWVINLQPMQTLDLDTAVRLATIEICSKDEAKAAPRIQAVQQQEEEDARRSGSCDPEPSKEILPTKSTKLRPAKLPKLLSAE
jgi:hypothetical protein